MKYVAQTLLRFLLEVVIDNLSSRWTGRNNGRIFELGLVFFSVTRLTSISTHSSGLRPMELWSLFAFGSQNSLAWTLLYRTIGKAK